MGLVPSNAHWKYPDDCCHNMDCGPIIEIRPLHGGNKLITIQLEDKTIRHGVFPDNFKLRPYLDNRQHACISNVNKPLCLFLYGEI